MTQNNHFTTMHVHGASMNKRMIQGGSVALVLILVFLLGVKNADPAWGRYWMVRPLLVVTLAGAGGGIGYYFMDHLRCLGGWKTVLAYILSLVGYMIGLWLGFVLGFNGTLWN